MAEDRSLFLDDLCNNYCRCLLCDNSLKTPRLLPCFHAFCTDCLEEYIQKQIISGQTWTIECPQCSRLTKLLPVEENQSPVFQFKIDTFIIKLSEVIDAFRENKRCDLCSRQNRELLASDWCMECFDAVCDECTKAHLCGKMTSEHTILSLVELHKLPLENILKRTTAHACHRHEEEFIKLYCITCQESACVKCLTSVHKACESCIPVSDAMATNENDVAELMVRLASMDGDETPDVLAEESGAGILEKSVRQAQEAVQSLATELRKKIDDSEKALLDRLHAISSQLHDKVGDFRDTAGSRKDELQLLSAATDRMDALLKFGSDAEILDLYANMKESAGRLDKLTNASMNSSKEDEVKLKVNFDLSDTTKIFSRDFEALGEISVEDVNCDEGQGSWGVTVTSKDEIIVADSRNKKVQKFASTGDLIDQIHVSEEPRDVANFSNNDVAITIMKKQIFIVTISSTMALKRRIVTEKQYVGIASSPHDNDDCLLVSCLDDASVDIISGQGDVIMSFKSLADGSSFFQCPRFVTFTKDGGYIVSDSVRSNVTCITKDGGVLFSYPSSNPSSDPPSNPSGNTTHGIKQAQGVSCDAIGNVFVADYSNSRVHLLTSNGHFQRFVLGRESGLSRPVAVAISNNNKLVVVQSDGMVKIFGYESMKVKFKGTCWCPRCLENMDKDKGQREAKDSRQGGQSQRHSSWTPSSPSSSPSSPFMRSPLSSVGSFQGNSPTSPRSPKSPMARQNSVFKNQRY